MKQPPSAKEIAAWHRAEAQRHYDLYIVHKDMADRMSPVMNATISKMIAAGELLSGKPEITIEQLNAALRKKQGRVAHVAQRLNTIPGIVETLLKDSRSEFSVGPRGFIYPKDAMPEK